MSLTDAGIRTAGAKEKNYKLYDGDGLYLLVTKAGGRLWRFDYRFQGKRKTLAIGAYPDVSLADARKNRADARAALAKGIDPAVDRKKKDLQTFKAVAMEWYDKMTATWSERHAETVISRLQRDVFPRLGDRHINDISPAEVLAVLRRVEARGALETAHRIKMICGQVFRYAVATSQADRDPAADLKGALPPVKKTHMAALTKPEDFADLLKAIDVYQGTFVVKTALRLAAYTFARPGELRHAEWKEIDFDAAEWRIPAEKMKGRREHIVPLSAQAVAVLRDLHPLTGHGRYVFPGRSPSRPMSENAVLVALRTMGFDKTQMTGHGFRATARTLLDEVLHQRIELIEHQMAHAVRDPLGRAYNRTKHLPERRAMMQTWADYCDGLQAGAKVIGFKNKTA